MGPAYDRDNVMGIYSAISLMSISLYMSTLSTCLHVLHVRMKLELGGCKFRTSSLLKSSVSDSVSQLSGGEGEGEGTSFRDLSSLFEKTYDLPCNKPSASRHFYVNANQLLLLVNSNPACSWSLMEHSSSAGILGLRDFKWRITPITST